VKTFRTAKELDAAKKAVQLFQQSRDSVEKRLESFPKYVRRQDLKRFLALYELFKMVLTVKGSIVECGVFRGFSLMTWAKLSAILEPENLTRRVYGFDTFEGFPSIAPHDANTLAQPAAGEFGGPYYEELLQLIETFDEDRVLGHIDKVHLIKGDATKTIPEFVEKTRHLVVSLLFLDFDLYEPTKAALEHFVPRMPAGSVLAFDELDNPMWPGESLAALDTVGLRSLKLQRLPWDPYIGYAIL
jgi:Macrocin-O-methyltransferase (TylF)